MKANTLFRRFAGQALYAALLLVFMSQSGAATLDRIKATGVTTACLDPDSLPLSDSRLAPPGYDVEIAEEFAKSLGAKLQFNWFVHEHTAKVLRQLYDEKCDFVIGLPTDKRLAGGGPRLVLSKPYLTTGFAIVVANRIEARGLDDLRGQRIGVQMNTVPDFLVFDSGFDRSLFAKESEIFGALAQGTLSAGIMSAPTAGWLLKQHPEAKLKILSELRPEFRFPLAVGVAKGDPAFLTAINGAIDTLVKSGRRDEILAKYNFPTLSTKSASNRPPFREARSHRGFFETSTYATPRSPFLIRTVGGSRKEPTEAPVPPQDAPAPTDSQPTEVPADQHESGFNLYHRACGKCHGRNAISGGIFPDLRNFQGPDEEFIDVVRNGRPGTFMPPWKNFLSPGEILRIRAYVKGVPKDS